MFEFESFDKSEVFENQIEPMIEKIQEICKEHSIPCLMAFCYAHNQDEKTGKTCVGLTVNARKNPMDALYHEIANVIQDFPNPEKLNAFARKILLADMLSDIAVDLFKTNKEASKKDEENEAE